MSSDSEEDCYGNIAQKLQSIKNTYIEDKIKPIEVPCVDLTAVKCITVRNNIPKTDTVLSINEPDDEEISLDTIIAQNRSRKCKRKSNISVNLVAAEKAEKEKVAGTTSKRKRSNARSRSSNAGDNDVKNNDNLTLDIGVSPRTKGRTRRRGRLANNTSNTTEPGSSTGVNVSRGRPARRGRGRTPRARGRTPRARQKRRLVPDFFPLFDFLNTQSYNESENELEYPTYSVGNTYEYPDQCINQELFSNKPSDTLIVEENESVNDSIDENEELSVKVYWRSSEYHKFNIRRFQKLTQIFKFFAAKENVTEDKLLFTYKDKIINIDDTPDSITYNIAKFIEGGIMNQCVSKIVRKDANNTEKYGLKIKFQCENVKKPFEIVIQPKDKMSVAMMMCAEHFEKPLDKLKFYFDGDLVSGKSTPKDLELEGDECIDVKIVS